MKFAGFQGLGFRMLGFSLRGIRVLSSRFEARGVLASTLGYLEIFLHFAHYTPKEQHLLLGFQVYHSPVGIQFSALAEFSLEIGLRGRVTWGPKTRLEVP